MSASKIFLVGLVTLFVTYSISAPSTNNLLKKGFPLQHLSYNNTHILSDVCSNSDSESNCTITLNALEGAGKSLSCDVNIKVPVKQDPRNINVKLALLVNDRALVLSKKGRNMKIVNLNFHGCSKNEAELEMDENFLIEQVGVVAYENTYDMFYANSKLCGKRFCRTTFDNSGQLVNDTVAWGARWLSLVTYRNNTGPIMQTLPHHNGFVVSNYVNQAPFAFVFNNEGKRLVTLGPDDKRVLGATASTIGNKIGTCANILMQPLRYLQLLECKEFDLDGKLVKTEVEIDPLSLSDESHFLCSMIRLNLRKGFILFAMICPLHYHGYMIDERYMGYRFDENGKIIKAIEIENIQCEDIFAFPQPMAFINDAGQSCFNLLCHSKIKTENYSLSVGVRCFTSDEL